MKIITLKQAKETDFKQATVVLGTFDGLHKGHLALIEAAKKHSGETIAFTFDALPIDVFKKKHRPMQLFTLHEKITAFEKTGIDCLCVTHFDNEFAGVGKDEFESLIIDTFKPQNIIAGYNYTYGKDAKGNAQMLLEDGEKLGCNVEVIPKVIVNGVDVSSTKIRECLWNGDVETANELLGYDYNISGEVKHGRKIGKSMGFPTANVSVAKEKLIPKSGVYCTVAQVCGEDFKAVCNIGINPTVSNEKSISIEVHIQGMDKDLYGEMMTVLFKKRIRDEKRFSSKEQLADQIKRDIESLKEL